MRTRDDIESEHAEILTRTIADLERLAREHQTAAGYLTSFTVGCAGQARKLREWLECATERQLIAVR